MTGVEIRDKSLRHRDRLVFCALVAIPLAALLIYWIELSKILLSSSEGWVYATVMTALFAPMSAASLCVIVVLLASANSFFKVRSCDRCGGSSRYYHKLRVAAPDSFPTKSEEYYFCSVACRAAYERQNMDYEEEWYYTMQTERDIDQWNAIAERSIQKNGDMEVKNEN